MSDLTDFRLQKLTALKKLKLDPYPQPNLEKRDLCRDIINKIDKTVTVAGRLMLLRGHGKILFADLVDKTGKIQLFFEQNTLGAKMELVKLLDLGDIISATGIVFKTQAGEITIRVSEFQILAKNLRPLPEKFHGLTDVEERYRQRYVDLIVNPDSREVFLARSKILTELRHFLDKNGFLEVETPVLQPVYGGASAKPFVTRHNELREDMYLRIADELYLKRLIVGGLEKVYEISKDFRNESVSRFHNPEFTQAEFYWAYVDYDVLMKFTEKLIINLVRTVKKSNQVTFQGKTLNFTSPFPRLTFRDAVLEHTGIDIDEIKSESDFINALEIRHLKLEITGLIGLGALYDALYKEYVRPKLIGPLFLTDYPAEMIALAKRKADNPSKIASFQLLACGTELLKAYNELNDPQDQRDRWLQEEALSKRGLESAMSVDEDYIRALEYGMPPTAGWGMGLDRLTQFLTDSPTIKDVILFPSMKSEETKVIATTESSLRLPASGGSNPKQSPQSGEIIIGKVLEIKNHPNAKSLKIVIVKVSPTETHQIVCGCANYQVGDFVPVALPGTLVPTPDGGTQTIAKVKLRGVESDGMLCSPLELGVSSDHTTIHLLSSKSKPVLGQSVKKYLNRE